MDRIKLDMRHSNGRPPQPKDAQFKELHLENWRNFVLVDVDLQRRVFLVGPNASGKSNLLDVFRFLRHIVTPGGGFQDAVKKRGGVSSLRSLAARRFPDVLIRVKVDYPAGNEYRYELAFSQDNQRRPTIKKESLVHQGEEVFVRPNQQDKDDQELLTQTHLEQVNLNRGFRELIRFFESIRYMHVVPQLIREPDRSMGLKTKNDPYGGDFLEQIAATPESTRKARLKRISNALRVAVPQLKEMELWRDDRGVPHMRGKYEHWRPLGAWQTEDQFSDGTLRLMGLLWAVLDGVGPLLLEEPELSLHPDVVRVLPQMFARIQRKTKRQIILSSHSSEILQDEGIGLDEILLLVPSREGTSMKPSLSIRDAKFLLESGLRLDELIIQATRPQHTEQLTMFGDL
jgi:predicted ATPase